MKNGTEEAEAQDAEEGMRSNPLGLFKNLTKGSGFLLAFGMGTDESILPGS